MRVLLIVLSIHTHTVQIEMFTDCYKIEFEKLEHARRAKKFSDAKSMYGGILHISYSPEHETIDELRQKLNQRRAEVRFRIKQQKMLETRKRKHEDSHYTEK